MHRKQCGTNTVVYRASGERYDPATRQRFRGVNCTLVIGVRFVGNVASKSVLKRGNLQLILLHQKHRYTYVSMFSSSPYPRAVAASLLAKPIGVYAIFPFSRGFPGDPPAPLTSQHRTVQSAPPLTSSEDSALKASE